MLASQVLRFLPAHVVPAVASFAGIFIFTRLASPAEYGVFALVMSVAQMAQSVLFYWIQVGATRDIDAARGNGDLPALQSAVYRSHAVTFMLFAAIYAVVLSLLPIEATLRHALWWAIAIVGLRSLVAVNQAFHRGDLRTGRFNLIECGQALIGLGLGLALLWLTTARAGALLTATVVASFAVAVIDLPAAWRALRRPVARERVLQLLRFGLPLSVSFALNYVLATSDRLMVEWILGEAAVGVYSVAYALMDRAVSAIFIAISLAAFPLAIRAFEREGLPGASRQLRANGKLLMAVALPVTALLMCANAQLAAVMVGPAFREQAAMIMPWVALAALLAGFQIHFFDHAFHLSRRTTLFGWTTGPAAVLNIGLNLLLLPRLGLMGAVWATLASYTVSLVATVVIGRRVMKVPLDLPELARVLAACGLMAAAVIAARLPASLLGLVEASMIAVVVYAIAAFAFDIAGVRSRLKPRPFRRSTT
jgi:O-antigen/teichoic acid export membrane protein